MANGKLKEEESLQLLVMHQKEMTELEHKATTENLTLQHGNILPVRLFMNQNPILINPK